MRDPRFIPGLTVLVLVMVAVLLVSDAGREPGIGASMASGIDDPWSVVFADDFDGDRLDEELWVTCYWWAVDGCAINSNGELQWYRRRNVAIDDGSLVLTARRERTTTDDGEERLYTSGMVTTGRSTSDTEVAPRFAFTYGRVEIRAKLPEGRGLWPAFWLLPADHRSRPEIDVLEVLGDDTSTLRMHYHWGEDERRSLGHSAATADLSADWHRYAIEWTPEHLVWFLDGEEQWRVDDPTIIPDEPMYVILNLAVGGDYPGAPDAATPFPSSYLVDSVTIWQRPGS